MACKITESFDTNIIMRLALRDVPEQCLRIQDLLMRQGRMYSVADLAVTEAVYVLEANSTREQIVEMLGSVLTLPNIKYNKTLFDGVFPMYLKHPKLSFNDCCLAVYAELNETEPLWTFDKALAKQAQSAKMVGAR